MKLKHKATGCLTPSVRIRWTAVVMAIAMAASGCESTNGGNASAPPGAQAATAVQPPAQTSTANDCVSRATQLSGVVARGINHIIAECLGAAYSLDAEIARDQLATYFLLRWGFRNIAFDIDTEDDVAKTEALVLQYRTEKALKALQAVYDKRKATVAAADFQKVMKNYAVVSAPETADVQVYGVARAAFAPIERRAKGATKEYLASAAGGFVGFLRKAFSRREIIKEKAQKAKETKERLLAALFDTQCLLAAIDIKNKKSQAKMPAKDGEMSCSTEIGDDILERYFTIIDSEIKKELAELKKLLDEN